MPWQGVCPMELRMRLVNARVAEEDSMTALCAEYGVSRKTGYKWLRRFRAEGPAGLTERPRAPHVVPWVSHPGTGRGNCRAAPTAPELGAEETARQVAGTGAGTALA